MNASNVFFAQCYASGKNLIFLDGKLQHIQTLLGANCGYMDTRITCVHVADFTAKVIHQWCNSVWFSFMFLPPFLPLSLFLLSLSGGCSMGF